MSSSTLTWLHQDAAERDRTRRVLQLFEERNTVDELGVGGIRDSIADQLFPGTSTIQTRLRYFLFIPWIYRRLEDRQVPPERFEKEARRLQYRLSQALLAGGEESEGVIGSSKGEWLKRTPDEIYWSGLARWGVRLYNGSMGQYANELPLIYRIRSERAKAEEGEIEIDRRAVTWHPGLPEPSEDWLEETTFALSPLEAEFLQDRIRLSNPKSLLASLAAHPTLSQFGAPWVHADLATFPEHIRGLLHHARIFSNIHHGAALLYNLLLARRRKWQEMIERHEESFATWIAESDEAALRSWSLGEFWALVMGHGYTIRPATRAFVEQWVELVSRDKRALDTPPVHALIEMREVRLKGPHARLRNERALEQWRGESGLNRLTYRWDEAQTYVNELAVGLSTK